jgi:hypothetical protein
VLPDDDGLPYKYGWLDEYGWVAYGFADWPLGTALYTWPDGAEGFG